MTTVPNAIAILGESREVSLYYGYRYNEDHQLWWLQNPHAQGGMLLPPNGIKTDITVHGYYDCVETVEERFGKFTIIHR